MVGVKKTDAIVETTLLKKIEDLIKPFLDCPEDNILDEFGFVIIAVRQCDHHSNSCTVINGLAEILADGLHEELSNQIKAGKSELYNLLRKVIREISLENHISDNETIYYN